MVRASIAVEKLGLPTVSIVCKDFVVQANFTASGFGMASLPISAYPGLINFHSLEEIKNNVKTVMVDEVINGLTVQPKESKSGSNREPEMQEIVYSGTFDEVSSFFYDNEWSDGLPVVPPTVEKVEKFLKYTDRSSDDVIGRVLPDKREATVWNIAVNGVVAGCRPEYMPVLIAIVEAMADPKFGVEFIGHNPGSEALIIINGPIIKELRFNYEQGALRVGFQANTSIGRFWRLYLRNVAGYLPRKTDKATFGGTWRVVLAENEDAAAKIGWDPLSVDQGFKAGDNVITVSSCLSTDSVYALSSSIEGTDRVEVILGKLAARIVDIQLEGFLSRLVAPRQRPLVALTPIIAEVIAKGGYTKAGFRQYLFEHARFQVSRFESLWPANGSIRQAVEEGRLPQFYHESDDPNRLVPIVASPDDFIIIISGDPGRDDCWLGSQNGKTGYPVSKKIALPANWKVQL